MARFSCAQWRPIRANTGGALNANMGLVLHHAVMNGSTWGWFNNPAARASAHFWVGQGGQIEQHVDTSIVAWHAGSAGNRYVGVETEGCARPPHADPMSDAMINALARLYAEGMRRHGWPNAIANTNGQRGFIFHRAFMNTQCPCQVRVDMRGEILRRAAGQAPSPATPGPAPARPGVGAPPFPGRLLRQPPIMRGEDVRQWQGRMAQRGWRIGVDGAYGPQSQQVCRSFQQEKRLGVDGIVGPITWRASWESPIT